MSQDLGDGTRRQNLYYLMKYVLGRKAKLVKIQVQKWSLGSFRNLPFQRNSLFFSFYFLLMSKISSSG